MNLKKTLASLVLGGVAALGLANKTSGEVIIDTVRVGNPGNIGELSGSSAGGVGADRICGAVDYEYNIGKYEVTAGQYTAFLNAVAKLDTYNLYNTNMYSEYGCKIHQNGSPGNYNYSISPDRVNRPVNCISFWDACRFANWLTNGQPNSGVQNSLTTEEGSYTLNGYNGGDGRNISRNPIEGWFVPSEDEWYKSAYHKNDGATGNYWDYPTQGDASPIAEYPPGHAEPPGSANYSTDRSLLVIGSPYWMSEVGAYTLSPSPYGTFDQGGNVNEWNESTINDTSRCLRGGSFSATSPALHSSYRIANGPVNYDYVAGFRVVYIPLIPEPTTLSLLALGGLGLLNRKRKE